MLVNTPVYADSSKPPQGLFDVYQLNRDERVPNLITPDLLLVSYSLLRENINQQHEFQTIRPTFQTVVKTLQQKLDTLPKGLKKEVATQQAQQFVKLVNYLLTGQTPTAKDDPLLQAEYQLIEQAARVSKSPLLGVSVDYTQLKPRGRYTQAPDLQQYFKAFKYATSVNFFIKASDAANVSPEEVSTLLAMVKLLSQQITQDPALKQSYLTLVNSLLWQYGKANDLLVTDIWQIQQQANFDWKNASALIVDYAKQQKKLPTIIDVPIDNKKINANQTAAEIALGWRFLPTNTANDLAAMQALTYPNTQAYMSPCGKIDCVTPWTRGMVNGKELKTYFKGVELLAALDINAAQKTIEVTGENSFEGYEQAQQNAKSILAQENGLNTQQLKFMQQAGKEGIDTESLLGFWTWQRYINLVYNKQPMSFMTKSIQLNESRTGAILKGSAQFYLALIELAKAHQQQQPHPSWPLFIKLVQNLQVIATQQQAGQTLSPENESFLNNIDEDLLALVGKEDMPIVVDVYTNPQDQLVIQEAIGHPKMIYQQKARGAQLKHYEFKYPMSQRLTNEEWRSQLPGH